MTWSYAESAGAMTPETVVESPETFEEFYAREYAGVVGLAYALYVRSPEMAASCRTASGG